jgi:hypothetical protein
MLNCLRQPGLLRHDTKTLARKFITIYKTSGTLINPAPWTKSIGLPADAHVDKVFAAQLISFNLDVTTFFHLPGPAKTLQP